MAFEVLLTEDAEQDPMKFAVTSAGMLLSAASPLVHPI